MPDQPYPPSQASVEPNDRIDRICYRLFNSYEPINALIEANPWMLDSLTLPVGKKIRIPEWRSVNPVAPYRRPQLRLNPTA